MPVNPLKIHPKYTGCGIHSVLQTLVRTLRLIHFQDPVHIHISKLSHEENKDSTNGLIQAQYLLSLIVTQSLNVVEDITVDVDISEFWIHLNTTDINKPESMACFNNAMNMVQLRQTIS